MKILTTIFALIALTTPTLRADEFHLGKPGDGRVINGVLLSEKGGMFAIRVEGGTIWLPVTSVTKYVKTELKAEDISKAEEAAREKLEAANEARREWQAAERKSDLETRRNWIRYLDAQRNLRTSMSFIRNPYLDASGRWIQYNPVVHRPLYGTTGMLYNPAWIISAGGLCGLQNRL